MSFIKKEPVLSAAAVLAVLSMFFVAPSPEYLSYIASALWHSSSP